MTEISISTMWSGKFEDMVEFVQDARECGFTQVELNSILSTQRLRELLSVNDLGISSIHAPCPNIETAEGTASSLSLGSLNEDERRAAVEAAVATIDLATEVGAKVVIIHAGYAEMNPNMEKELRKMYSDGLGGSDEVEKLRVKIIELRSFFACPHVDAAKESLLELAVYAREKDVQLALENRVNYHEIPDMEEMLDILSEFEPEVMGYWHDVGHAEIQSRTGFASHMDWFAMLGDRILGVHLHDLRGLKDHYAPGSGDINWQMLAGKLPGNVIRVCEIAAWNEPEDTRKALDFLEDKGVIGPS